MALTPAELKIHQALEKTGGNWDLASAIIGLTKKNLQTYVSKTPELRALWGRDARAGGDGQRISSTPEATLHRDPADLPPQPSERIPLTKQEREIVTSMIREDALVSSGLEKLALTEEEARVAVELAQFHEKHFVSSAHVIGASVTRMCLKLQTQLNELDKRLADVREMIAGNKMVPWRQAGPNTSFMPTQEERQALVEEEGRLTDSYVAMTALISKMFEISQRAMILQAMVRWRMTKGDSTPTKPGFQKQKQINGDTGRVEEPAPPPE